MDFQANLETVNTPLQSEIKFDINVIQKQIKILK